MLIKLRVISYFTFIDIRVKLGYKNFYNLEHFFNIFLPCTWKVNGDFISLKKDEYWQIFYSWFESYKLSNMDGFHPLWMKNRMPIQINFIDEYMNDKLSYMNYHMKY